MLSADRRKDWHAFGRTGNVYVHVPSCTHTGVPVQPYTGLDTHLCTDTPSTEMHEFNTDLLKHTCTRTDTRNMQPEGHTYADV